MKHNTKRILALLLCAAMLVGLLGCSKEAPKTINIDALTATLLDQVTFDTPLADTGADAALYYPALPQNSMFRLFIGSGYYADELAVITLASEKDADTAKAAIDEHLSQKKGEFLNYLPNEVPKIENAIVWQEGRYIVVVITADTETANRILDKADDPSYTVPATTEPTQAPTTAAPTTEPTTVPVTEPTTEPTTVPVTEPTTEPVTEPATEPVTEPATEPSSQPTTEPEPTTEPKPTDPDYSIHYHDNGVLRVGNAAYEPFYYSSSTAQRYANVINRAADAFGSGINVYCLLIPTAIGITFPEEAKANYSGYTDQDWAIEDVYSRMNGNVITVNCYDNLKSHSDEYLYFRTDFHWNGTAAYYAYESFCWAKGIAPIPTYARREQRFDNYLGALYWYSSPKDYVLKANPDTVIAYHPASEGVTMTIHDANGNVYDWYVIADVTNWDSGSKYLSFAGGDNPLTVFRNPSVTDGSACIVVKESYGNAMMSYIVDHYSTVYEIDYRYWTGNLVSFAQEKGVTDVLFANNMFVPGNSYKIGQISALIG